jgi:hypothetical protein
MYFGHLFPGVLSTNLGVPESQARQFDLDGWRNLGFDISLSCRHLWGGGQSSGSVLHQSSTLVTA